MPDDKAPANKKMKWFPLESNPDLMNEYIQRLGINTSQVQWVDVLSTEDWALEMIPRPVYAVILLYPLTDILTKDQSETDVLATSADSLWFVKQRIGNACGTIGLLHALMNTVEAFFLPKSWIDQFASDTKSLSPLERAARLEGDTVLATLHEDATASEHNQTDRGNLQDDELDTHFVAFYCSPQTNQLVEFDGRKQGPMQHGDCTPETLLEVTCKHVKDNIMAKDPTELRFTILALTGAVLDDE
jgi:ubiquitin carboxyl-terminal hydrolase L3